MHRGILERHDKYLSVYLGSYSDGVMGRPETMCPRKNFPRPRVPKMHRPRNTKFLPWYIPIMNYAKHTGWCIMTRMYQCRDIVFPERFLLGPRKFMQETSFQDVPSSPQRYSPIINWEELGLLRTINDVMSNMSHSHLCRSHFCRLRVLSELPRLVSLDFVTVTDDDRKLKKLDIIPRSFYKDMH